MVDLQVATVQDTTSGAGKAKISKERSQASGWLWDEENEMIYSMSKRISAATGLEANRQVLKGVSYFEQAEPWQVGVYSPGGHYLPHYDAFDEHDDQAWTPDHVWVGNRIATAMVYLSEVTGGYTAFPELGVAAKPQIVSPIKTFSQFKYKI